jgi:hypothetical protein
MSRAVHEGPDPIRRARPEMNATQKHPSYRSLSQNQFLTDIHLSQSTGNLPYKQLLRLKAMIENPENADSKSMYSDTTVKVNPETDPQYCKFFFFDTLYS